MKFAFQNPTKIFFGEGQISKLTEALPKSKKILVTYGGGSIKSNGVYDQVKTALEGFDWGEFSGIEPNPQYDTLMRAVEKIRSEGFDYLLAVGGGSVVDGTKFISVAAHFQGEDPWAILSEGVKSETAIPLSCVLTLPATGSESNAGAVVSRGKDKLFFGDERVRPEIAVLDPSTTLSLSERQVANGIVDAWVHVMEQYLTYPVNAKVQDEFAEGLLRVLREEGPKALANPQDLKVRSNIMWAATQALNGLIGVGVPQDWSTHMIGHELTALFGVDHGRSLTIMFPAVMQYKREQKRDKILQYADKVLGISGADQKRIIDQAIAETKEFFSSLGVPTSLGDINVDESQIPDIVAALEKHGRLALGEHQDIELSDVRKILKLAL